MKYKGFKLSGFHLIVAITMLVAVVISSCNKNDDTYKNYQTTAGTFAGNALMYLQSQPGVFDSMLLVINRLKGMPSIISNDDITLFAVSNRSFSLALQNINQARRDSIPVMPQVSLSEIDSTTLDMFFCRYILNNKVHT